jgi:uncharacterized repeat protein (TIGR01451 family)
MRFGRSLPLLAAFAASAVALMILAGAGTAASTPHPAKASATSLGLASVGTGPAAVTKIQRFLRSVGIDPRTVVIQTGKHNYAGARCPGKRWTCTTATRVFQAGSDNVYQCTPAGAVVSSSNSGGTQSCELIQNNPTGSNSATCTEHTDSVAAVQYCKITQVGRSNVATVNQQNGSAGTTESASQTAIVNQSGASGSNRANITQTIAQDASGADALLQNGWARADLVQSSSGTGTNTSNVTQNIRQGATGGTSLNQDTLAGSIGDCDPGLGPLNPNLCANISQTGVGGNNTNSLFQKIQEKGSTTKLATQHQGSGSGGIDGKIHQDTGSTATNYSGAYQHKIQSLLGAPGSSQTQFDPMYCCGAGSQAGGNSLNQDSLGQGFAQDASEHGAAQSGDLVGQSLSPNGSCSISHDASNNARSTTNGASENPCPFLVLETSCSNGSESGGCTAFVPITTPPVVGSPDSSLAKCVRNVSAEQTGCTTDTLIFGSPTTVEYQLTYLNDGTGTAHNVQLFDAPPSGVTYVSCTGGCTPAIEGPGVIWSLGDVPAGESRTVTWRGTTGCTSTSNTASGSDDDDESFTSNAATTTNDCLG